MRKITNDLSYLLVEDENFNSVSFLKSSIKKLRRYNDSVFLELIDDIPYFLDYTTIENPATPGEVYVTVDLLYADLLYYLYIT